MTRTFRAFIAAAVLAAGASLTAQNAVPEIPFDGSADHFGNFIKAVRSRKKEDLNADILEGHLSATLPHLANISYRVGRSLTFDGKTETCTGDAEANRLLTREYRQGFAVPEKV